MKSIVEKANFDCTDAGIAVVCMDNSHTTLIELFIQSAAFEDYSCDKEITLGLNIESFSKILKSIGSDYTIELEVAKNKTNVLSITAEDDKVGRNIKFGLNLVDIDSESVETPEGDSEASLKIPSGDFARLVKDFSSLGGDSLTISINKESVKLSSDSQTCSTVMTINKESGADSDVEIVSNVKGGVTASFDLKHLNNFAKSTAISDHVKLNMSKEQPLIVAFEGEACKIRYFLAPKVDEDDEENVKDEDDE